MTPIKASVSHQEDERTETDFLKTKTFQPSSSISSFPRYYHASSYIENTEKWLALSNYPSKFLCERCHLLTRQRVLTTDQATQKLKRQHPDRLVSRKQAVLRTNGNMSALAFSYSVPFQRGAWAPHYLARMLRMTWNAILPLISIVHEQWTLLCYCWLW